MRRCSSEALGELDARGNHRHGACERFQGSERRRLTAREDERKIGPRNPVVRRVDELTIDVEIDAGDLLLIDRPSLHEDHS